MRHSLFILAFALCASFAHAEEDIAGGIGAIIDAGAPIAIAGIQAGADKEIGRINADAAVKMTQITADTTKYIANDQGSVALYQARTAQQVNEDNQRATTERLAMQLSALADARHGAEAAEQAKLVAEQQYNMARIELAKKQAADTVAIAKQQLNLQVMISGLTNNAFGYSNKITLGNGVLGGSAAGSVATATTTANDTQRSSQDSSTETTPPPRKPQTIVLNKKPIPRQVGGRSGKMPARLLASVGSGSNTTTRGARGLNSAPVRGAMAANSLVRGSFAPPGKVVAMANVASRISLLQGRPHATGEARASTTVSTGDDGESAGGSEPTSHHSRNNSAAD